MQTIMIEVPEDIKKMIKDERGLTNNEAKAVNVLIAKCEADPELREVMTMVRGDRPEHLIKHYFRNRKK